MPKNRITLAVLLSKSLRWRVPYQARKTISIADARA